MKKLMFATALVASAAAFADPTALSATSFEGYGVGTIISNSVPELDEDGTAVLVGQENGTYFWFDGDSNSSVVTNETPSAKRTAYFKDAANTNKYLALDTEGGTFWRSINPITPLPSSDLGTAQPVAATGTYLDTLVQFTVTEDEAPTVGSDDKLAIWLQADQTTGETNLMVKAAHVKDTGSVITPATNYVVSCGNDIIAGRWYRLTVKAIPDVSKSASDDPGNAILGFLIYIDGEPVVAAESTFDSSYIATATDADWGWIETSDTTTIPLLQSKTVFPSLEGMATTATLQGVGFQGTGAVDEIVWTTENPIAAPAPEYPDYLENADSTIKDKYDDWKTTYSADTASVYENEFLVNANPATTTVTSNALEITEIKENTTDGGWDITIGCSIAGVNLTGTVGSTIVCNGYLAVSYTDDLTGTWTTENIAVTEVDSTTGTVTVNVNKNNAKFMKVSLTVAPQAAPGGAGAGE